MLQNKRIIVYDEQNRCVEINGIFSTEYDGKRRPGVNIFHIDGKLVDIVIIKDMPSKLLQDVAGYIYTKSTCDNLFRQIAKDKMNEIKRKNRDIEILESLNAGSEIYTRGGFGYTICHKPIVDTSYFFRRKYINLIVEEMQTKRASITDVETMRSKAAEMRKMVADHMANSITDEHTVEMVNQQEQILNEELSSDKPNVHLIRKAVQVTATGLGLIVDAIQLWIYMQSL